jgi:hypothetical protein
MDVFAQHRTHQRAVSLAIGQLACLGPHTITGLLSAAGRLSSDWSADYRFFSQDRWQADRLFDSVLTGVLGFLDEKAPLVAPMDDTLLRKTGRKIPGAAYRRDPLSPAFHTNFVWAQRYLQMSAMLPADSACGPARAIPLRFDPAPSVPRPPRKAGPEEQQAYRRRCREQNLSTFGVAAIAQTRRKLDQQPGGTQRRLIVPVDGSYTNRTVLRGLAERTTLIGRIRKDAELFYPPLSQEQPDRGRKRQYGRSAPTPDALRQEESVPWQEVPAHAGGKTHTFRVKTLCPVLWPKAGADMPLRLVVIAPVSYRLRKGSKLLYRQPAYLICTDPDLPLEQGVQDFLWRWDIEVNHRQEKQLIGVGRARVRSPLSARREPTFAVACYAKLLLAGARTYGPDATQANLPLPKWRRNRPANRLTSGDLIRQLRQDLWGDAVRRAQSDSGHFASEPPSNTKCLKFEPSLAGALEHTATG